MVVTIGYYASVRMPRREERERKEGKKEENGKERRKHRTKLRKTAWQD